MEEPSFCNLSLAVDCTLSLGSTTARNDIPARLSRAGSPDQDLTWSLAVRSDPRVEDPSRRTCEEPDGGSEQAISWGGSCCNRSDPDVSPDYYPQVLETEARGSDGARSGPVKAWARTASSTHRASHSGSYCKDEVKTSEALFSMTKTQSYGHRSSRQPVWLSSYIPSTAVEVKAAASLVEQCMQEGDSCARVCAHCGTSKTPLWRNGPGGPKSLCNACGIRFKKAGRRSAANGACDLQLSPPTTPKAAPTKRKLASEDQPCWGGLPAEIKPRKRSRGGSDSVLSGSCMTWQSCLLTSSPKSTSSLQRDPSSRARSTPQGNHLNLQLGSGFQGSYSSDEEEGAVLLMALSCGMVNG